MKQRNICRKTFEIVVAFVLVIIICVLSSCEGFSAGDISTEELKNDLVSIELMRREYSEHGYTDTVVGIATEDQQHEIIEKLSLIKFRDWRGAPKHGSSYMFKLTYSDKYMLFSPYDIDVFDADGNFISEESYMQNFSEELNTLLEEYAGILKARI